jgi:hypothetical protein
MTDKRTYTAKDIDNMRALVGDIASFQIKHLKPSEPFTAYQQLKLAEKMLQTYILAGVTYDDLTNIYSGLVGDNPALSSHV